MLMPEGRVSDISGNVDDVLDEPGAVIACPRLSGNTRDMASEKAQSSFFR
jgi:hypothetical protein